MTGTPKPPEGISGEGQNNTATAWDTLREYPANIEKAPRKYIDTIMAPERASTIGDYARSGLIFSDMVGLAKDLAEEKNRHNPKTSEESQPVLLIFGGVCVPVYENSDPEKLEAAWARVMRGHYDKQMEIPGLYGNNSEMKTTYPLVTKTLDNIPEEVLAAEAQADEARRNARDSDIQWADTIIDRENKYEKLKEELQGVEIVFNTENTQPSNVLSDGEKLQRVSPFKKVFKAQRDMHFSWAILWAKLMQQRLNDDKTATIRDIAEDTLGILDIKVDAPGPLFSEVTRHLVQSWNHGEELSEWYRGIYEQQGRYSSPLPPEAQ
jgi:hypothetical protein